MAEERGSPIKVFVNKDNQTKLQCPSCKAERIIDTSNFKNAAEGRSVRCRCGESFRCIIEFRKFYRKDVKLTGEYIHLKTGKRGEVVVESLSMGGVGFRCLYPPMFKQGDRIKLIFRLDNPKKSEIQMQALVKHIYGELVGVQRTDTHQPQAELGFYLM